MPRRAAGRLAPGGPLLSVTHASSAPWSWADPDTVWPTPKEELDKIGPAAGVWTRVAVEAVPREATGPDGRAATVTDNVVALERRVARGVATVRLRRLDLPRRGARPVERRQPAWISSGS